MKSYFVNPPGRNAMKKTIIRALIVLIIIGMGCFIIDLSLQNHKRIKMLESIYFECCLSAQTSLFNYLNNEDERQYEYLISNIYAMSSIAIAMDEDSNLNKMNYEVLKCYSFLVEQPAISKQNLDFLNEALLLYINDSNIVLYITRIRSFNNRVYANIHQT